MKIVLLVFLAIAASALASPAPKPIVATGVSFTQGVVTRTLNVPRGANCQDFRGTPINGEHGQRRFSLICSGGSSQSWVQFDADAGPIYAQWLWPVPPPVCPPLPAPRSQPGACPAGTQGTWTQTAAYSAAQPQVPPDGCWVLGPYLPATPPAGACTASQGYQWQAPRPSSTFPLVARPAKGGSYVTPYGTTVTRVTDAQADAGVAWLANWYNRFEAVNADGSLLLAFQPNGFWDLFDARTNAFVRRLQGPAGDAEIQWDPTDPNVFYYLPINGGTVLFRFDVAANASTVQYDFTSAVHALWPSAVHCWTKSEGSPSQDGRFWGLMCESANWQTLGFVKLDVVSKTVVWSKVNTGPRPDNVTITPNGLNFIVGGLAPLGITAYATDGSNRTCLLHTTVEHVDIGKLSNGHDFIVYPNFTSGNVEAKDIDTCTRLDTNWAGGPFKIYGNPILDNTPAHSCANCGVHPSAKAYGKPGWVLLGFYGEPLVGVTPPSNIIALNVETGAFYGAASSYAAHGGYWDEAHCFVDRTFAHAWCSENWLRAGTDPSYSVDIVRIDFPPLP